MGDAELEHDPEKWEPVFRKKNMLKKKPEPDSDSTKNDGAPAFYFTHIQGLHLNFGALAVATLRPALKKA
jgi:hypothetical protein